MRHFFKITICLILTGCVYYNTFYNAEVSYENASKIIEQSSQLEGEEIPPQAKKLLGEAIDNSKIVLEKYPNSKYIDDAYFIIAKASFLRNEVANAEQFLIRLIDEFPLSEYKSEADIWLAYSHLRMGNIPETLLKLSTIKERQGKSEVEKFLIQNIYAEIAISEKNIENIYLHYENAAELIRSTSKKTSIYLKLVKIAESENDLKKAVEFLSKLAQFAPENIRKDAKIEWIIYNRKLGNYDSVLTEIEAMLGMSEYLPIYKNLELEQAKIYLDIGDLTTAKLLFSELIDRYQRKNESAEAFYHLGYIALMETFDMDLSREYFEKSKKDKSVSKYGKLSKEMLNVIDDFESLIDEYDFIKGGSIVEEVEEPEANEEFDRMNIPMPTYGKKNATPDSLLFTIAEKLMFDFKREDVSILKFKQLIEKYPESKFTPQAMFVLSITEPNAGWQDRLNAEYPESVFLLSNDQEIKEDESSIEYRRNQIWNNYPNKFEVVANKFKGLYDSEGDSISLYLYAFLQDEFLNHIELAIEHYQLLIELYPEHPNHAVVSNRIKQIEDGIQSEIDRTHQKLNYQKAILLLNEGAPIDSISKYLEIANEGEFSSFRKSAQQLLSKINGLSLLKNQILAKVPDTTKVDSVNTTKLDSLYLKTADIYGFDFNMLDSSDHYYNQLLTYYPESKFVYPALIAMDNFHPNTQWQERLNTEYPDSNFIIDSTRQSIHIIEEIFQSGFSDEQENYLDELLQFIDNFFTPDTIITVLNDSLDVEELLPEIENRPQHPEFIFPDRLDSLHERNKVE